MKLNEQTELTLLIQLQLKDADDLKILLQEERQALIERNISKLPSLSAKKMTILTTLKERENQIRQNKNTSSRQSIDNHQLYIYCEQLEAENQKLLQRIHLSYHKLQNKLQQHTSNNTTYGHTGTTKNHDNLGTYYSI